MKFSSIFGKKGFGRGSFGGKDSSGQSIKCIGGAHPRALSPRRWGKQKGRTLLEMLAVLAIIGVLSITALVGFTYAMNKHRANETIYDVMLRGTNVPMIDEYYYDKASGYEFRFPGLVNNGRQGTYYPMTTKKDAGSSYYVEATGVTYRVCEMILKMNPTDIDQIVVGSRVYQGDSDICGDSDGLAMRFCFGSDGTICNGTGIGSGDSSGSGSGSGTEDPCEGIVASTDCGISEDVKDENGCVLIKKISCSPGRYCLGQTCEPCPVADTCSGESCCALTGPNDVCGNPTKEIGTISTVTHSDLNSNGCCESTTEESCSLNPITPRTCTPTCEGTCQGDGTCEVKCPLNTYTPDCLPCGTGAISDGTTSTCTCDIESGFTGIWSSDEANPDNNGCIADSSCSSNADCVSDVEFCGFEDAENCLDSGKGKCLKIADYGPKSFSLNVGGITNHWVRSSTYMSWWSAQNWCAAQRLTMATRSTLGCGNVQTGEMCSSSTMKSFINGNIGGWVWLEDFGDSCIAYRVGLFSGQFLTNVRYFTNGVLCR